MNKDVRLLNEALDVFRKIRNWVPPEFYKEQVTPTVFKIKERLAVIETELFMARRTQSFEEQQHEAKIKELENTEPDTIPSQLMDITSQFGLFNLDKDKPK